MTESANQVKYLTSQIIFATNNLSISSKIDWMRSEPKCLFLCCTSLTLGSTLRWCIINSCGILRISSVAQAKTSLHSRTNVIKAFFIFFKKPLSILITHWGHYSLSTTSLMTFPISNLDDLLGCKVSIVSKISIELPRWAPEEGPAELMSGVRLNKPIKEVACVIAI